MVLAGFRGLIEDACVSLISLLSLRPLIPLSVDLSVKCASFTARSSLSSAPHTHHNSEDLGTVGSCDWRNGLLYHDANLKRSHTSASSEYLFFLHTTEAQQSIPKDESGT